jgi:catechol 2,3-dioxygenase-like lactoylglutathione lyase family enzyme
MWTPLGPPLSAAIPRAACASICWGAEQKREQKYGMEHIAIDTDELDNVIAKLKAQNIHILEQTVVSGGRRVCFFEGPDGVQLEFIEMKGSAA